MPEREALALMEAIDAYMDAYGRDPAYGDLVELLGNVKGEVQAARGEGPEPESPGSQAARQAADQPPEGVRERRREDASRGPAEQESFEEAGKSARSRVREDAKAESGTASRGRGRY